VVENTIYCDESIIYYISKEDLPLYLNFKFEESIKDCLIKRIREIVK